MARKLMKSQNTWPCIKELIGFLLQSRDNQLTTDLRMGINHAIIFYSACYVEGVMEYVLKTLLSRRRELYNKIDMPEFEIRRTTNTLFNALEEDLEIRISRSTGISTYLDLINLLTGNTISQNPKIGELLEGINILFQFRNVLAHGREISAARLSAYWIKEPWQEIFLGGYKRAEEYLIKIGLLDSGFMDSNKVDLFFTNSIADHFWDLSSDFIARSIDALEDQDKIAVSKALSKGMKFR
ncbi:MAG: hypothetical protein E3J57_04260 [Dehalococcoidia bacterium]|nr:MAG: hypothetical protein E3J57_04260 [Dehalococcoidia bacterium]